MGLIFVLKYIILYKCSALLQRNPGLLMFLFYSMVFDSYRWMKIFTDQQHSWEKSARVLSSLPSTELHYCTKCGMVLLEKDLSTHDGHGVIQALTDSQLQDPTTLLSPMDDRKSQAVRLFFTR